MYYQSKYLKDTGLIQAYQSFLAHLMNIGTLQEDPLLEASKFILNYEKKHKVKIEIPYIESPKDEPKKERKRILLETKPRIHPSGTVITPKVFEKQERTRPVIGSYKTEEINYNYNDILDGHIVNPNQLLNDNQPDIKVEEPEKKNEDVPVNNPDFEEILEKEIDEYDLKKEIDLVNKED
jgi:hypothetical protein